MAKRSTLQQYCLKAPSELFSEIDKNRMLLAGISNVSGTTRADYIRDAIEHYNRYFTEVVERKVKRFKTIEDEFDDVTGFYYDNGVDVRW